MSWAKRGSRARSRTSSGWPVWATTPARPSREEKRQPVISSADSPAAATKTSSSVVSSSSATEVARACVRTRAASEMDRRSSARMVSWTAGMTQPPTTGSGLAIRHPVRMPGGTILVAGEALYDLVPRGDGDLSAHPGGGPFNTARTIARLEQPVTFLGRLSSDRFGATLERMLAEDGVALDAVVRTMDPTTLAVAEVDAQGVARYRFYTQGTSAAGLTTEAALAALPDGVDALHVGTLGLALEPVAGAVEAVVERLAGRALVMVDPNIRPWAIADPAAYRARLERVLARTHVVKVSEED